VIGLVDYGMGNRRSVEKALEHVGARVVRSSDPERLRTASALVLPGVGAFPEGMRRLRERGLEELLRERFEAGVPLLGICLGMELAFEHSSELGGAKGLGIVPGRVRELDAPKLPHIGWNLVRWEADSPLLRGLEGERPFYHVHSYVADPAAGLLGSADYGERFCTAVAHGSFYGVQFHPEKSSRDGLQLLANFVATAAAA
jgi:glutamine amidotransferase